MKKILLLLITFLFTIAIQANKYSFLQKDSIAPTHGQSHEEYRSCNTQEYESSEELDAISEYETHVCDYAKPPKVSPIMAFLTQVGCSVLINYIVLKQHAHTYFIELKNILNKWFSFIA